MLDSLFKFDETKENWGSSLQDVNDKEILLTDVDEARLVLVKA